MKRSRLVLPHREYKRLTMKVMARDKWRCRVCGRRSNLHAHHLTYRSHGGDDAEWNLITVCHDCHDAIHKPDPHGRMVLVLPLRDGEPLDANGELRFVFANGWLPKREERFNARVIHSPAPALSGAESGSS